MKFDKMKIMKKSRLTIAILTIVAITGFLPFEFKTFNGTSDDNVMNSSIIKSSITVTRPDNSSKWPTGDTEWIYFTSPADIFLVNITLYKDGIFELALDEKAPVTGAMLWDIPSDLEGSSQYQIKIAEFDNQSNYDMSPFFEIYQSEPPEPRFKLGSMAPTIVLIGIGLLISACFINNIVRRILVNKRRKY